MISVAQAERIILTQTGHGAFRSETVALTEAYGRVLRENIVADRDQPAFDKSTMDGIAIRFETWQKGVRKFQLEGIAPAGQKALKLKKFDGCIQIMTGAVVPDGCDCVVPVEHIVIKEQTAIVSPVLIQRGQFIRYRGADLKKGQLVLKAGSRLLPPVIATAASFGRSQLKVSAKPKMAIISTGDELVDVTHPNIKPYQTRTSNSYALDAMLSSTGLCETELFHFVDDRKVLLNGIKKILTKFDIVILSGGVSMGKFDFVPQVLHQLGVEVLFHKVAQKPGKPFWFGKNKKNKIVFALPGNPVSTQICGYRYLMPYLHKAIGLPYNRPWSILTEEVKTNFDLTSFVPVKISSTPQASLNVTPVKTGGSGDYGSLALADGFIELEAGHKMFPKGSVAPFYGW
jgi:molybdopterin molybdotransferase